MNLTLEHRVWFWAAIGPLLLLASSCLCTPLLLLAAVLAVALATLWGWRGLTGGLGLLILTTREPHWWEILLSCSLAMTVVITSLALRQLKALYAEVQLESRTHLQRSLRVEEEFKKAAAARQLAHEALAQFQEKQKKEERLEGIKITELEVLQSERDELVKQVREQRAQISQVDSPDGHWRERVAELEDQLSETAVALAEAKGKIVDGGDLRTLRAQLDVLREQLLEAQSRLAENAHLRNSLNELRVDRYQLRLDLERNPAEAPVDVEVLELESIVEGLVTELQKRSTPMLTAVKPKSKPRARQK